MLLRYELKGRPREVSEIEVTYVKKAIINTRCIDPSDITYERNLSMLIDRLHIRVHADGRHGETNLHVL